MKKTDIAMIILIASISVIGAYFIAKAIIGDVGNESVDVKTADKISSAIVEPNDAVFNKNAINPTVKVIIGNTGATTNQGTQ